jgi:hypothetical protein
MTKPRRRQAGEGGISQYTTKAGAPLLDQVHRAARGRDVEGGPTPRVPDTTGGR